LGKIFISHSSVNNAEALAIHDWLTEQGWGDVFLDLDPKRGLVAGDRWQAALKAAAEQCELILIVISPDWAKSRWCLAEFLLAKQMNKQILGVVVEHTPIEDLPVELTAEWQLVDLSAPDTAWSTTISPPRYEPETTVSFSGTGLARLRAGLEKAGLDATTFLWPPPHDLGRAPYRGLLPLDQDDAGIFFGRDGAIVLTLDALRGLRAGAAPRFATILGASGAGKSSFLRAGILPRLHRDSRHFYVLPILRPERAALTGEHGFAAMLEAALRARNITRNRADIRDAVKAGADAVAPLLRQLAIPADAGDVADAEPPTLVIAVDQAEELLGADNAEAGAFLTLLADLGRRDDPPVLVIFTVRSDSFDALQSRPELAPTQPHHLIDLPPVPAGSFGDIIRGPARRVSAAGRKLHVDETLVDALLGDIEAGGTKDALPLLAFTLERLYTDYGADGDLQLAEYERLGRIRGAIEAAVEQALAEADGNPAIPKDRAARLALLRRGLIPWLAGIDPATGSPRRRVARLAEVPEEARPLIELMVEQRLLATDVDTATRERTIEPAHEALLRQWGALDGWLAEDSADLATIEALRRAASEWEANALAGEFIAHRGARLEAVEQVAAGDKFASYLTSVDRAYLGAARETENAALRKARAARTRLAIAASVVGVVLVAGATAGWFIWQAGEAARTQAAASLDSARSEAARRAGRPEEATLHALEAFAKLPDSTTRTAAFDAGVSISPHSAGLVPMPERFAASGWLDNGVVRILARDGTLTDALLEARKVVPVPAPAFDTAPVGLALDGNGGGRLFFADAGITDLDGRPVAAPPVEGFAERGGPATSRDGAVAVFRGLIGDTLVRDCRALPCIDSQLQPPAGVGGDIAALAVAPDGSAIAAGWTDGTLAVYSDFAGPPADVQPAMDLDTNGPYAGLALSSSGALATIDRSGRMQIYPPGGLQHKPMTLLSRSTPPLEWSPDGSQLAAACGLNGICLYDGSGRQLAWLTGHVRPATELHWSPDGHSLNSYAPGEPMRIWSVPELPGIVTTIRHDTLDDLTSLAVDPARRLVAAGDQSGRIWTWTDGDAVAAVHEAPPQIGSNGARVTSIAFLADGRFAAVYENKGLGVWRVGGTAPDRLAVIDNATFSRVAALAGDVRLAVPLTDGSVFVLSGDGLREATLAPDTGALTPWGVAASHEPNTAYISHSDGSIRKRDLGAGAAGTVLFDAANPVCDAEPTTDNNGAKSLDVSPDGKWLAATRSDTVLIVHNLAEPQHPLCLTLLGPDSKTVAFSPDSSQLAVLSATDQLYVFDLAKGGEARFLGAQMIADLQSYFERPIGENLRRTSWLDWLDADTLMLAAVDGTALRLSLDPAGWRARVDTLFFSP
jgi:WD40 repeat protein